MGIPILFTDKTFVLDFTSIATLFAFVLVCGGVLLIPRKEKTPGKFNIPYVNGKLLFPAIIIGTFAILLVTQKNYIADKFDFSFEEKVAALSASIPDKITDSVAVTNGIQQSLATNAQSNEFFAATDSSFKSKQLLFEKINVAKQFVGDNNPLQSKTGKVSTVIFWLLMLGLSLLTFARNYSLIPLLGVATCMYLLTGMSMNNWLWFGGWLLLGLLVYFMYGYKKSKLSMSNSK